MFLVYIAILLQFRSSLAEYIPGFIEELLLKKVSKHLDGSTNRFEDEKNYEYDIYTIEMNNK